MIECASPGCQGRIEDGFCGVCGLAPVGEPPPATLRQQPFPPPPGPAGPPGPPDSGAGRRPHSGPPSPPSHPAPHTGIPGGHIVMEYVGGKSLRELLIEKREQGSGQDVLPIEQVIAYGLEGLRALGYPHSNGLLYCDFKPDNVIQNQELIKLIDLGGVRCMDDGISPVYTTPGYRVPEDELPGPGPSISADLYSVGWTLAVLSFDFGFIREHPHSLPPRHEVPLLQRFESYDRFLRRATIGTRRRVSTTPGTWPTSSPECSEQYSPRSRACPTRRPPPSSAVRPSPACPIRVCAPTWSGAIGPWPTAPVGLWNATNSLTRRTPYAP